MSNQAVTVSGWFGWRRCWRVVPVGLAIAGAAWLCGCPSAWAQYRGAPPARQEPAEPSRQELDGARHRLNNFRRKVELARGQPMRLDHDANEALRRIRDLKERFPEHPAVEEMFQEARRLLMASKGEMVELDEDVLLYRRIEQQLKQQFAQMAEKEWNALVAAARAAPEGFIDRPWPLPVEDDTDIEPYVGQRVVLTEFEYPANQFIDLARNFVYIGTPSRGFYFVELHGRPWTGAYEAFRRYRRQINRDIPEQAPWHVLGRISGIAFLVPEAGEEKRMPPEWGWTVRPEAFYIPGCTLAVSEPDSEIGGRFSGEEHVASIKDAFYTVREIPADVTPDRLVEIFSIAIKEKNYDLYLDCILPERRETRIDRDLCAYHWDWHQYRFATFYALIQIDSPTIRVRSGFDEGDALQAFFLDDEEREKIRAHSGKLVEEASVVTRAFDEKGKQYGSPKTFLLRREDRGRWYIVNYAQPF